MATRDRRSVPPSALFVVGAVSMYVGATIAVDIFDEVGPRSVAWLRVSVASALLVMATRPWRSHWPRDVLLAAALFGVVTAAMNTFFYLAAERVNLGSTVAIEFLGPVAVATVSVRSRRAVASLALVATGVGLLGIGLRTDLLGVGYALAAAACWAGYIIAAARVSHARRGVDGLAVALLIGAIVFVPIGAPGAGPVFSSVGLLVACLVIAVCSTIVPYGIDQHVLRRVDRAKFAMLLALLPVTATIVGRVVLTQEPTGVEIAGIAVVVVGLVVQGPTEMDRAETGVGAS